MEVHVADIAAARRWIRQAYLCIQIRAVQVDLTTILVDNLACILDYILKYSICRWIGDLQ